MRETDRDFIDYENARLAERWRMIVAVAKDYTVNTDAIRYMILAMNEGSEKE